MSGRLLGVDLGERRVGLAVSDELGLMAHPFETLAPGPDLAGEITHLAEREGVHAVVLGLPLRTGGELGPEARRALLLKARLEDLGVTVHTVDERLSTIEAERQLRASGRDARRSRERIDEAAACVILQAYLDRHRPQGTREDSP